MTQNDDFFTFDMNLPQLSADAVTLLSSKSFVRLMNSRRKALVVEMASSNEENVISIHREFQALEAFLQWVSDAASNHANMENT